MHRRHRLPLFMMLSLAALLPLSCNHSLNKADIQAHFSRANADDKAGSYPEEIKELDQALKSDPQSAYAYDSRGVAYERLGNYKQAAEDYTEATAINPQDFYAYNNR